MSSAARVYLNNGESVMVGYESYLAATLDSALPTTILCTKCEMVAVAPLKITVKYVHKGVRALPRKSDDRKEASKLVKEYLSGACDHCLKSARIYPSESVTPQRLAPVGADPDKLYDLLVVKEGREK